MMKSIVKHLLVMILGYSITATGLECDPVDTQNAGASCLPVKAEEASCAKRDISFDYSTQLDRCFGEGKDKEYDNSICYNVQSTIDAEISCESDESCSSTNVPTPDLNLTFTITPFVFSCYNLSITVNNVETEPYRLLVVYRRKSYCLCISADQSELNLTLKYTLQDDDKIEISTPLTSLDTRTFRSPRYCAHSERHIRYDPSTCGLPQLEKPSSIVLQCNEAHTRISWEPACYKYPGTNECIVPDQTMPDQVTYYYLTLITGNVERNKTHYSVRNTTAVTVNVSSIIDFELYAYSPCSGLYQRALNQLEYPVGCSQPANCTNSNNSANCATSLISSCNIIAPTPSPSTEMKTDPTSAPSRNNHLAVYIAAGVGGLVILITALVVIVVICILRRPSTSQPTHNTCVSGDYTLVRQESPSQCDCSVLVVYSSSTPELETMAIMQKLGHYIQNQEKGIGSYLQDTRKPQEDLIGWITKHHKKANAVFCVCNEEFSRDWENSFSAQSNDSDVAVRTLRQLFEGELHRGPEAVMKYAVVLPKPSDKVFIPTILLNQCKIDMSDTERLVKFVRQAKSRPSVLSTAQVK